MKNTLSTFSLIYVFGLGISFFGGSVGANRGGWLKSNCLQKPTRIEKMFPTYKLGCYLFSSQDKWYYEQNEFNNE